MARSGCGISAIFASTSRSPSALSFVARASAMSSLARSLTAARSSVVNPADDLWMAVGLGCSTRGGHCRSPRVRREVGNPGLGTDVTLTIAWASLACCIRAAAAESFRHENVSAARYHSVSSSTPYFHAALAAGGTV